MGEKTEISWADATFNPWWGCIEVSPSCDNCYARTFAKRVGQQVWGAAKETPRRFFADKHWAEPLAWNQAAEQAGERRRVFCASMADVFEENADLDEHRLRLWSLIEATPHLDWMLLTKRPQSITRMVPAAWLDAPRTNVWYGTTVENQHYADLRIPILLRVPAAVRFLSCEPLLGPVDLSEWIEPTLHCGSCGVSYGLDEAVPDPAGHIHGADICAHCGDHGSMISTWGQAAIRQRDEGRDLELGDAWDYGYRLHWVIVGGESGHGARPSHPDWFRNLRDQCQAAGVAYHFKQWGEYGPTLAPMTVQIGSDTIVGMTRLGKKAAGRLLDGVEHNAFPAVATAGVAS